MVPQLPFIGLANLPSRLLHLTLYIKSYSLHMGVNYLQTGYFSSLCDNMFFTNLCPLTHYMRFPFIRSNASLNFLFMFLTEFICWISFCFSSVSSCWTAAPESSVLLLFHCILIKWQPAHHPASALDLRVEFKDLSLLSSTLSPCLAYSSILWIYVEWMNKWTNEFPKS